MAPQYLRQHQFHTILKLYQHHSSSDARTLSVSLPEVSFGRVTLVRLCITMVDYTQHYFIHA